MSSDGETGKHGRCDSRDALRDALARMAIETVRDGMTVGLGTGRAASRGIHALAEKAKQEHWKNLMCVATSGRSTELAVSLGLIVVPMREVDHVDVLFDGVDELDPNLCMTKGAGGAMTREKIVAETARHRVYLMDQTKRVNRLGERFPLPVEVLEFALNSAARRLKAVGLGLPDPVLRLNTDTNEPYRTDEGNLILDCAYGDTSKGDRLKGDTSKGGAAAGGKLIELSRAIDAIPGVIGHGLFADHADVVLIEDQDTGDIEKRERRR